MYIHYSELQQAQVDMMWQLKDCTYINRGGNNYRASKPA